MVRRQNQERQAVFRAMHSTVVLLVWVPKSTAVTFTFAPVLFFLKKIFHLLDATISN